MKPDTVLKTATLAGRILLENGAETIRVEETVTKICEAFEMEDASAFATPTGLFVSFDYEDETYAKVLRIKGVGINLGKINQVNDISRRCSACVIDEKTAYLSLKEVAKEREYTPKTKILASGFVAMFFTFLFEGTFFDASCAFIIGVIVQYIGAYFDRRQLNSIVKIMFLSAIITTFTLLFSYIGVVDSRDKVNIGTLMLLVPGVAITNAVRDSISGDLLSGVTRAIEACLIAIALALGAGVVLSLWMHYIGGGV